MNDIWEWFCRGRSWLCQWTMLASAPPPSSCSSTRGRGALPASFPPPYKKSRSSSYCVIHQQQQQYVQFFFIFVILSCLSTSGSCKEVFTNHFYVKIDPDHGHPNPSSLAHNIAKRNGFHNLGPVLGSDHEFNFVHHGLPHARHKRSVPHSRKLKSDPQVRNRVVTKILWRFCGRVYQLVGIFIWHRIKKNIFKSNRLIWLGRLT